MSHGATAASDAGPETLVLLLFSESVVFRVVFVGWGPHPKVKIVRAKVIAMLYDFFFIVSSGFRYYFASIESRWVRVCLPKTIERPSGDQVRLESSTFGSFSTSNFRGFPPLTGTVHSAVSLSRRETKAMDPPSRERCRL